MSVKRDLFLQLCQQAPTPIAQLAVRAQNESNPERQHHNTYYLFELWLRLITLQCLGLYLQSEDRSPSLDAVLASLNRPSIGHWVQLLRSYCKQFPASGAHQWWNAPLHDESQKTLLWLSQHTQEKARTKATHKHLVEALAAYRNQNIGHGALHSVEFYREGAETLSSGIARMLLKAKEHMPGVYLRVEEVFENENHQRRAVVFELEGGHAMRLPSPLSAEELGEEFRVGQILFRPHEGKALSLYPWVLWHDEQVYLYNKVTRTQTEYLCYLTGQTFRVAEPTQALRAALASTQPETSVENEDDASGYRIGPYQVMETLGRGGMGTVYKAHQLSLDLPVALKLLPESLSQDSLALARWSREIEILKRCEHPNIVSVLDAGEDHKRHYYVMELIDGASLSECYSFLTVLPPALKQSLDTEHLRKVIQLGKEWRSTQDTQQSQEESDSPTLPDWKTRAQLAQQALQPHRGSQEELHRWLLLRFAEVADALSYLHGRGFLHRDIKPSNIMLSSDGAQAILMDFGLARSQNATQHTKTGSFVGTLRYTSREQAIRSLGDLDFRADLYSLGATMYELFTLSPLYGDSEEECSQWNEAKLLRMILDERPPSALERSPYLKPELAIILEKLLEKQPERRFYQSAAELADDLRALYHQRPIRARDYTPEERRKFELYDSLKTQTLAWSKEQSDDFLWGEERVNELVNLNIINEFDLSCEEQTFYQATLDYAEKLRQQRQERERKQQQLQESLAQEQRATEQRKARARLVLLSAILVFLLTTLGITSYLLRRETRAKEKEQVAKQEALQRKQDAENAKKQAMALMHKAEQAEQAALQQKQEAEKAKTLAELAYEEEKAANERERAAIQRAKRSRELMYRAQGLFMGSLRRLIQSSASRWSFQDTTSAMGLFHSILLDNANRTNNYALATDTLLKLLRKRPDTLQTGMLEPLVQPLWRLLCHSQPPKGLSRKLGQIWFRLSGDLPDESRWYWEKVETACPFISQKYLAVHIEKTQRWTPPIVHSALRMLESPQPEIRYAAILSFARWADTERWLQNPEDLARALPWQRWNLSSIKEVVANLQNPNPIARTLLKQLLYRKSLPKNLRARVIVALGKMGTSSLPLLSRYASAHRKRDTGALVRALVRIGPHAIPVLERMPLQSENDALRVLSVLETMGANALDFLQRLSHHPHSYVRRKAIKALARVGNKAIPAIVNRLNDRSIYVKREATNALAQMGPAAIPALRKALQHRNSRVRSYSLEHLIKLKALSFQDITRALQDPARQVKASAVKGLGRQDSKALPYLKRLITRTGDYSLRQRATIALGQVGPQALPLLQHIYARRLTSRFTVINALAHVGPAALPLLQNAFVQGNTQEKRWTTRAAGKLGPHAISWLKSLLKSKRAGIRNAAIQALGQIGSQALPALDITLQSVPQWSKIHVLQALGSIGPQAAPVLQRNFPKLLQRIPLQKPQSWYATNAFAKALVKTLAKMGPNALPLLKQMRSKQVHHSLDATIGCQVAKAARNLGADAARLVIQELHNRSRQVQRCASQALASFPSSFFPYWSHIAPSNKLTPPTTQANKSKQEDRPFTQQDLGFARSKLKELLFDCHLYNWDISDPADRDKALGCRRDTKKTFNIMFYDRPLHTLEYGLSLPLPQVRIKLTLQILHPTHFASLKKALADSTLSKIGRGRAADVLGRSCNVSAIPLLFSSLQSDKDWSVRTRSVLSLSYLLPLLPPSQRATWKTKLSAQGVKEKHPVVQSGIQVALRRWKRLSTSTRPKQDRLDRELEQQCTRRAMLRFMAAY